MFRDYSKKSMLCPRCKDGVYRPYFVPNKIDLSIYTFRECDNDKCGHIKNFEDFNYETEEEYLGACSKRFQAGVRFPVSTEELASF